MERYRTLTGVVERTALMTATTGPTSAMIADLNLAELIVQTLKSYGKALPKEFLARVLNQQSEYVDDYLTELQQKNVVRIQGDMVDLKPESEDVQTVEELVGRS